LADRVARKHGFVSTHELEKLWLEQFDFAYEEYDTFIFPMSIHPQVSGKPHVIKMHERYVSSLNATYRLLTSLALSTTSTNTMESSGCHLKTWPKSFSKAEFKESRLKEEQNENL